jgi:integrase
MKPSLYHVNHPKPLWQVVYSDPAQHDGTRHKRIRRHFVRKEDAEAYLAELSERLIIEGTAGVAFDATLRQDAIAARRRLVDANLAGISLLQAVTAFIATLRQSGASGAAADEVLAKFVEEKELGEGCAPATVATLRNRLTRWLQAENVTRISEITRARIEAMRLRPDVSAQTRRNDMAALSTWCSWLLDRGYLDHHPLKGLKRPKFAHARPATWTAEETERILKAAQSYLDGKWFGTLVLMVWTGCRPSELAGTRVLYERPGVVRIEGGKLRGRANRVVALSPAAKAWLRAAGNPVAVDPVNTKARRRIAEKAGVRWTPDVTRHTWISMRIAQENDEQRVAQEAGTSPEMIHRHYRAIKLAKEARAWAALRP